MPAAGGSVLLAYNVVLILTFVMSALGARGGVVVVHTDRLDPRRLERLRQAPIPSGVSLLATLGADRIYGIAPASAGEAERRP